MSRSLDSEGGPPRPQEGAAGPESPPEPHSRRPCHCGSGPGSGPHRTGGVRPPRAGPWPRPRPPRPRRSQICTWAANRRPSSVAPLPGSALGMDTGTVTSVPVNLQAPWGALESFGLGSPAGRCRSSPGLLWSGLNPKTAMLMRSVSMEASIPKQHGLNANCRTQSEEYGGVN